MNQSELEANTRNRWQAQENVFEKDAVGFGFTSYCLKMVAQVLLSNHKV